MTSLSRIGRANIYPLKNYQKYILFYLVIGCIFPVFKALTGIPSLLPAFFLFLLVVGIISFKIFFKTTLFWIYFNIFITLNISFLNNNLGDFLKGSGIYDSILSLLVTGLLLELLIHINDQNFKKQIGKFALILFTTSAIFEIFAEISYPLVTRNIGRHLFEYPRWIIPFSFTYVYTMPYVAGSFIAFYKGKAFRFFTITIILIGSVLLSGLLYSIIFCLILSVLAFMHKYNFGNKALILSILTLTLLIGSFKFELLDLMGKFPNEVIKQKSIGIRDKLLYGEGDVNVEDRQRVYEMSMEAFSQNIWVGSGSKASIGGHSLLLDKLAQFGLIGILPFLYLLWSLYKRAKLLVPKNGLYYFQISITVMFLMLFVNPYGSIDFWSSMFVFTPCIITFLLRDSLKTKY